MGANAATETLTSAAQQLRLQQAALENTANAIVITDLNGTILWTNPAFTSLTGYSTAEVCGLTPALLKSGQHDQAFYDELWRTILSGQTWRGEFTNRHKDGTFYHGEQVITAVRSEQGDITHFVAVMNDITARRQAEAAQQATHRQLQHVLDHSPAVSYGMTIQGGEIIPRVMSENISRMLGFTAAEALSMDWWLGQLHPDDRNRAEEMIATALTKETTVLEYRLRHRDGTYRWIEEQCRMIRDHAGKPAELVGILIDITERKRMEAAAREMEVRFRQVTENIREVFWLTDPEKNEALYVSPAYERIWGRPREDLRSAPRAWMEAIHSEDRDRAMAAFAEQGSGPSEQEFRIVRPDGSIRWIRDRAFPVRNEEGKVYRIAGMAEDITERKRAAADLRETERRFTEMLENVALIAMTLDRQGVVTFCNDYLLRLTGWRREEIIGRDWFESFIPECAAQLRTVFFDSMAAGTIPSHYENPIITRAGKLRQIVWNNTVLRDGMGKVIGTASIGEDVTERRRAEKELREQQEQWRTVVTASPNAIFVVQDQRIVLANQAAFAMFGATARDDLIGRFVLELVHEDCREMIRARMAQALVTDGPLPLLDQKLRRLQGSAVDVEASSVSFQFQGRPALLVEARDIRERKRAERRLQVQHAVTTALAEAESATRSLQCVLANLCQGLGFEFGELWRVDRNAKILRCVEVAHPDARDLVKLAAATRKTTFARTRGGPGRVWELGKADCIQDITLDWKDERHSMASAVGLHGWMGFPIKLREEILGVVGFFASEMTPPDDEMVRVFTAIGTQLGQFIEREELAEQFRQAQKMEAIGTLAGGIAHDFNNIIAAITGYTELAKMDLAENSPAREHLEAALVGASRATDLVRQILSFSRQQENERRPIQLRHIVTEALNLLRATIPATIEFVYGFEPELPAVLADPTQVHQVVMNLGTNAWHAMKDRPGRLEIKLARATIDSIAAEIHPALRPGDYVQVSVSDTGHGMDESTCSRIFEPFFTTKAPGEGTGLGLAVVHGIMQTHDGAVTVYSQLGEGTVFHLYFPVCADEARESNPTCAAQIPRGHGERVLYVDDEAPLARMGLKILERLGYAVEAHTNPSAALAALRAAPERFDLVITDLTMPGITGTELAREALTIRSNLPIVLITGYTAALTPARVKAMGIRDLLLKPISVHTLGSVAARALSEPAERNVTGPDRQ